VVSKDLGGQTLAPGVYKAASAMGLTGTVTLDGHSDPNAVFIFQAGSTLITASSSTVKLIGGAQACNVFWQVGSSATLGPHHLRWKHPGVDLGDGADQNHRGRTGIGPKRPSQPGQQHHHTTGLRHADSDTDDRRRGRGVIPSGHPETGAGGTSHSGDSVLMTIGVMALLGAGAATGMALRRRRELPAANGPGHSKLGGDE
jgi:hypothetical protein